MLQKKNINKEKSKETETKGNSTLILRAKEFGPVCHVRSYFSGVVIRLRTSIAQIDYAESNSEWS